MEISTQFVKMISGFFGMFLLLTPITVLAQTKTRVVVIPLGDEAKPLKNIITVAKANGNFTDPRAAVNSITDASATNPYLVVIGPGVYTITHTVQMKPYVEITGSGENVTKLTGAISTPNSASSAVVAGANFSALSSLTVENTGGSTISIALYNDSASPVLSNVTAMASGGTAWSYGIRNDSSSPTMTNVTATASGVSYNYGVYNRSSSPKMTDVIATASGGQGTYGVLNDISSSPIMTNVTATGSGGTIIDVGVYTENSSSAVIRRSTIDGDDYALYTPSGTTVVSQSTLRGDVSGGTRNKCVACDNGSETAFGTLDSSCQPIP